MARRDTLTAVDTAATGVGLLAWGVATRNRPVAVTGFATAAAVAAAAAAGWWIAAAVAAGAGWLLQIVIAARQPKGPKFAEAAAVAIGAVSAVHYATAINLRCASASPNRGFASQSRLAARLGFAEPAPPLRGASRRPAAWLRRAAPRRRSLPLRAASRRFAALRGG